LNLHDSQIFDGLNAAQLAAVTATDGPVLVVAGPGTGKTHTMVRRIAYLIHLGINPGSILAVTFTNRAAREMKERTEALLGGNAGAMFIGTFHLLGLRIIQDNRTDDFVICSRDDQIELLKPLVSGSTRKARQAVAKISRIKSCLDDDTKIAAGQEERSGLADDMMGIYEAYQFALRQRNALDFDDLILTPVKMLGDPGIAQALKDRFRYIMVDEYQDINPSQYRLLRLMTNSASNLCAVGDSDQAIYAFRGADIGNFLNFEKDYPRVTRIMLSESYRSTGTIIHASNALIRNNKKRIEKTLFTAREQGMPISVLDASDDRAEGEAIVREIEERMGGTSHLQMRQNRGGRDYTGCSYRFSDFAVIYRTNAQARALEESFSTSGIPYQVIGRRNGAKPGERDEAIAYLRSLIGDEEDCGPRDSGGRESKLLDKTDFFDSRADAVALMTMHMAKGLEFPVVFIVGADEGLIPSTLLDEYVDMEEERRLFYVGMTRAKNELFLIHARLRILYGRRFAPSPSPYIGEIPAGFIQKTIIPDKAGKQRKSDKQMGFF
jgi:DNA helicase II / ATP-dependent DNA helicase PcrA